MDQVTVTVFAIVTFILIVIIYNQFISLSNQTKNAWSDIDVLLKRRHDLIPNLVTTVRQYAKHEEDVFDKVTKARTEAMTAGSIDEKSKTENVLTNSLSAIFAIAENYPELKASQNFLDLSGELTSTEDDLAQARRFYNTNVRELNTKIDIFPYNIFAKVFAFKKADFFEISEDEKTEINI